MDWDSPAAVAIVSGAVGGVVAIVTWALTTLVNARVRRRERAEAIEARNHAEAMERQRRLDDYETLKVRTADERSDVATTEALSRLETLVGVDQETWESGQYEEQLDDEFDQLWRLREKIRDAAARDALELVIDVRRNLNQVAIRAQMGGDLWTIQRTCVRAVEVLSAVLRVQPPPDEPAEVRAYREVVEDIHAKERHAEAQHAQKHAARRAVNPSPWPTPGGEGGS